MKGLPTEAEALGRWGEDVLTAAVFLTRVPAGRWREPPLPPLSEAMRAFPIVGALVGLAGGAVLALLAGLGAPPLLSGALTIACLVFLTGALHEDGLADMMDGFGGGGDRQEKLAIMRDSRIGTFGVIALVLVLIAKAACLGAVASEPWYAAFFVLAATGAFSRALIVWVMGTTPSARPDGLSAEAGQPVRFAVSAAMLIGGILGGLLLLISAGILTAVIALAAGWAVAAIIRSISLNQIGGQTGDICGSVQVLSETAMLAATVIMLR